MKTLIQLLLVTAAFYSTCFAAVLNPPRSTPMTTNEAFGVPTTSGDVGTWDSVNKRWTFSQPPGASGGEANTAANLGSGYGLFSSKAGVALQFNSLMANGSYITLVSNANTLIIGATGIQPSNNALSRVSNIAASPGDVAVYDANGITNKAPGSASGLQAYNANTTQLGSTIEESELNLSDNTTGNATTGRHGFLPKLPGGTSTFLNGSGLFSTPPGGSGGSSVQVNGATIATPNFIDDTPFYAWSVAGSNVRFLLADPIGQLGGLTLAPNKVLYVNGSGALTQGDLNSFALTFLDDADFQAVQSTLHLTVGTQVEAWNANLDSLANLSANGWPTRISSGNWASRSFTAGTGIQIGNNTGSGGNPTWSVDPALVPMFTLGTNLDVRGVIYANSLQVSNGIVSLGTGPTFADSFTATNGITNLSATANTIAYHDANKKLSNLTIGSGLDLTGGTLSATGGGGLAISVTNISAPAGAELRADVGGVNGTNAWYVSPASAKMYVTHGLEINSGQSLTLGGVTRTDWPSTAGFDISTTPNSTNGTPTPIYTNTVAANSTFRGLAYATGGGPTNQASFQCDGVFTRGSGSASKVATNTTKLPSGSSMNAYWDVSGNDAILYVVGLTNEQFAWNANGWAWNRTNHTGTSFSFTASAMDFDGTSCWMERDADYTGNSDSKSGILSVWLRFDSLAGTTYIVEGAQSRSTIWVSSSGNLRIEMKDSSNTMLVQMDQNTGAFGSMTTGTWYHILASWDKSVETRCHLYINGTSCLTKTTFLSDDVDGNTASIDYTQTDHSIGAYDGGLFPLNGCMSELYYAPGQYLDFSNSGNRAKFVSGGVPVDLGSNGSTPTGSQPLVYLKGVYTSATSNSGSGGNLVKKGSNAFTDCSTHP